MFKLTAGIPGSELPVDCGLGLIAFVFQVLDFPFQGGFIGDAAVQALSTENGEFHFSHVEPTPALRSVVELQPSKSPSGFRRGKGLVKGSGRWVFRLSITTRTTWTWG